MSYREGDKIFYVSTTNKGIKEYVTFELMTLWENY
jgi:hypothetical protein